MVCEILFGKRISDIFIFLWQQRLDGCKIVSMTFVRAGSDFNQLEGLAITMNFAA